MEQLLDPRRIESYKVPTWISAELRSYQKDGVNWLAFLSRFNLHGILCDGEGGCDVEGGCVGEGGCDGEGWCNGEGRRVE